MSRTDALQISSTQAGPALSPSQKRFNMLIRQIEQARQTLAAWQDNVAAYRRLGQRIARVERIRKVKRS